MKEYIVSHISYAHFIIYFLLLGSGCSLPISEEVVVITSAIIASTIIPENTPIIFLSIFLGCYSGDSLCYWIGRIFGRKVLKLSWFKNIIPIFKIKKFYKKHALSTFLIGRFIPGGRNAMILSAGISKLFYIKFLSYDCMACILTNSTLFFSAYYLGPKIISVVKKANIIIICTFVITLIALLCYHMMKKKNP